MKNFKLLILCNMIELILLYKCILLQAMVTLFTLTACSLGLLIAVESWKKFQEMRDKGEEQTPVSL